MKRGSVAKGFVLGALTSVLAVSILHAGNRAAGLPFAPFEVFEWMTRWLPGAWLAAGIDLMVTFITALGVGPTSVVAKAAEKALAVVFFVSGSAVLGALVGLFRRPGALRLAGLAAGMVWLVVVVVAETTLRTFSASGLTWLALVMFGWGLGLAEVLQRVARRTSSARRESGAARRRFLASIAGGIAAASAVLLGLASLFRRRGEGEPEVGTAQLTSGSAGSPSPEALAARTQPAAGTRAELTPNDRFYRIDIDLEPPRIEAASWRLHVDGLVKEPLAMTMAELRSLPAVSQIVTLECISNPVGGDLISTSRWTGARLRDVLRLAGASENVRAVHIQAADGFYESVGIDDINDERTLLVYEMNGVPLPVEHGFPLRIYIPNRYGMKQPKWITRLRVSDQEGRGYWVDRGWSKDAIVGTTSVIDMVRSSMMIGDAKVLPVGGIAYAGARGISKVEIQVDDGPWEEATLVAPPLSALTWVLWRYDWPYQKGRHAFRVRAYDGSGALQSTRERPPHPDGATGLHAMTFNL
jgi:DMSO/TMAO reductase YedYZ molybdopterin-dependent catalytic subunit